MRTHNDLPSRRRPLCDWATLFDGRPHELEPGIDFFCKPQSRVRTVKIAARRLGIDAEVYSYLREDGREVIFVQAKLRK